MCLRGLTEDVEETHDLMLALLEREREAKALLTSLQYKSFRALSSAKATIAAEQIGGRALLREGPSGGVRMFVCAIIRNST